MAQLQCSIALLKQLDAMPGEGPPPASAPGRLGDWGVTLFPLENRKAALFMSQRTLLSFVILEGKPFAPSSFATVFWAGLSQVLEMDGYKPPVVAEVLDSYSELVLTKTGSASRTAQINNLAQDYKHAVWIAGGLKRCDLDTAIRKINQRPRKPLNYATAQEATRELLAAKAA